MNYNRQKHYLYPEIIGQIQKVKEKFVCDNPKGKRGIVTCKVLLQPTEFSPQYTVQLKAQVGKAKVWVHVLKPQLQYVRDGSVVPHIYPDDLSLCLYYPKYNEWNYADSWADTIVPWTALWLYYYEIWVQTGEWLGGGIHVSAKKERKNQSMYGMCEK